MTPTDEAKKLVAEAHAKCPSDHAVACDSGLICCDCAQALVTRLLAEVDNWKKIGMDAADTAEEYIAENKKLLADKERLQKIVDSYEATTNAQVSTENRGRP